MVETIIELDRNNAGAAYIGAVEVNSVTGIGIRAYVLSGNEGLVHDKVMERRFGDMVRLMGDNVTSVVTDAYNEGTNPNYPE